MQHNPLAGRIAIVTGATAGIGEAIARALASLGANVVVNGRRRERLDEVVRSINAAGGGKASGVAGDASLQATVDALLEGARRSFGADADIVVVNAGRGLAGSVLSSDTAQWEEMVETNLLGAARLIRACAPRLVDLAPADASLKRPRDMVILGSTVGRHISPFSSMYGSTKFAVGSLAEAARRELGPRGVRVTHIAPGVVKSEFQAAAGYDPKGFGEFMDRIGPVLVPEDIARLVVFIVTQPANVHVNDVVIRATRQEYP